MESKNTFLKVMSILMLIVGIFGTISFFVGLGLGTSNVGTTIVFVGIILAFVAASIGFKALKDPSKVKTCLLLGIIIIVIVLVGNIISYSSLGFSGGTMMGSLIMSVLIPVLYTIAAAKSKPAA